MMKSKHSNPPGHPVWQSLAHFTKIMIANPALHTIDQVPDMFKEVFILSGYRSPRSSPWECIASIFQRNNETFNFWTHFLPALYFWWRTLILWPSLAAQGPYAYPMMTCMVSISTFPIMSAVAHIFNTMSDKARHVCFFLDYAALGFHVLGSAVAYRAYVFPRFMINSLFTDIYLHVAALFSVISLVLACHSRFLPSGFYKKVLRMTGFSVPYFFVSAPYMLRIILCEGDECSWTALLSIKSHFFLAFLSAFLFASHVPERLYPGRFDIVGHSHQLFHFFSVLGSYEQMNALLQDMENRHDLMLNLDAHPPPDITFRHICMVIVFNSLVLIYFINKLKYIIPATDRAGKQRHRDHKKSFYNNNNTNPELRHRNR